jgi:hypothetical protein
MPVTYTNSLRPDSFPGFRKSFLYINDSNEDAAFVGFVRETLDQLAGGTDLRVRNLVIDRSGAPSFQWETWERQWVDDEQVWVQTGSSSLGIGAGGTYWRYTASAALRVAPFNMTYYWECDDLGRAYDVNDLVVP